MTTQETSALMAFYHVTAIEDWTCTNVMKYYRAKLENKAQKNVLDYIKKDLTRVAKSSEFDITRQEKAQKIIDDWKVRLLMEYKFERVKVCLTLSTSWDSY